MEGKSINVEDVSPLEKLSHEDLIARGHDFDQEDEIDGVTSPAKKVEPTAIDK